MDVKENLDTCFAHTSSILAILPLFSFYFSFSLPLFPFKLVELRYTCALQMAIQIIGKSHFMQFQI